jgi:hypothetical protein
MKEYEIVLTADRSFLSQYHLLPFLKGLRFASTSLLDPSIFFRFVAPSVPTNDGLALLAPYHTRRTEAALLDSGFDESEVAVAAPESINSFIGPNTKIVSITVRDPLSKIYHYSLLNPLCKESYSSLSFKRLVRSLHFLRLSQNYRFKVVVEGPGAWQLANPEYRRKFTLDHVVAGEYTTNSIPHLFEKIIRGEQAPEVFHAASTDIDEVPLIRGGVVEGRVEVGRGCNRGCQFCAASRLQCRPLEDIVDEARVNVRCGQHDITLRNNDILNYGAKGIRVNRKAILSLYESVSKVNGVKRVDQCYLNLASAASEPSLIKEITDIIGAGCKEYPYATVLVGIESGSPRLIRALMPGKASPFKPSEWPEVVERGFSICNESHWVPLGMLILGLPGETEEDVSETINLVERLSIYKSILIPFVFKAKGMLNTENSFDVMNIEKCHLDLVKRIFSHNIHWGKRLIREQANNMSIPKWLFPVVSPFVDWSIKRAHRRLFTEIFASTSSTLPHQN